MQYGDVVTYVKDGKPLNAIVVKSSGDILSLIYLDPTSESMTHQGNLSRVVSTAIGVRPLSEGATFGWQGKDYPLSHEEEVKLADEVFGMIEPGFPESPHAIETKTYSDGTTATGPGPLPEQSPAQQEATQEATADPTPATTSEVSSEEKPSESPSPDSSSDSPEVVHPEPEQNQ